MPRTIRTSRHHSDESIGEALVSGIQHHRTRPTNVPYLRHTIFEGTSEIQQLVIARAISGLRIE